MVLALNAETNSMAPELVTQAAPEKQKPLNVAPARPPTLTSSGAPQLAPGVYKTEPYTCLVLVPDPHADDKMIKSRNFPANRSPETPRMPGVTPDLRFVPRKPAVR